MRRVFAVAVLAALAGFVPSARAADGPQSLGEVAAKDKDKKKTSKVYTEDDLHNGKHGGTYSQPAADGTTTAASPAPDAKKDGDKPAGDKAAPGDKPKTEDELHAEAEKQWRDKVTAAQAEVTHWTGEVNRLQSALNDTSAIYGPGRAARADALESAKQKLAAATQSAADLQEEGRRNRYH